MPNVTALIVVNSESALEWLAHKTLLEWTYDALKKVTALEGGIVIGVLPEIWEAVKPHIRQHVAEGKAIQFPGAAATDVREIVGDLQALFPESKRFIVAVPDHPLFPSEKYEAMFAATEKAEFVFPGRETTVRQVLPNGRALNNKGLWQARGVFAHGLGRDVSETVHVDLTAVLDAADPSDRHIMTKLIEG